MTIGATKMYFQYSQVGPNSYRVVGPDYDCIHNGDEAQIQATCTALHKELRDENLKKALAEKTDGLFFKYQAGELSKEDWLAARQEVIAEYPDVGV